MTFDANNPPSALDSFAHLKGRPGNGLHRPGEFTGEVPKARRDTDHRIISAPLR